MDDKFKENDKIHSNENEIMADLKKENENLKTENKDLKKQIQDLNKNNANLRQQLKDLKTAKSIVNNKKEVAEYTDNIMQHSKGF